MCLVVSLSMMRRKINSSIHLVPVPPKTLIVFIGKLEV